ncbi:MAG: nucleotide sugar dehydrogenase [Acidobacteria bacterium]|nr:nucleotide sugar dehydrogenase [Acidobacteriota bacterium]
MNDQKRDSTRPSTIESSIVSKIEQKAARVGVIGLGYVGLPLALSFVQKGFETTGFDTDPAKVEKLGNGKTYIRHIPEAQIARAIEGKRFHATDDFSRLREMDAIIMCVPTPLDTHREPDLSFIHNTAKTVSAHLVPGQLVVLESTTYPGTTEEVLLPLLEESGLRCPVRPYSTDGNSIAISEDAEGDFLLAFSPEREDPGNKEFERAQIPKIIGGVNAASARAARAVYGSVFARTVIVSSSRTAEMTKLLENIYRCVNIALVNELKLLSLRMGIDIFEVIEAAKTKPFGFTAFYPGPGLGGHCIPIDPFYLTWKAREYGFTTRFIELAGEVNSAMPAHVVEALSEALNRRKQCLHGARILLLGVAYKKDIDDLRESPSLEIMELLLKQGARVEYHDPYFPRLHRMRRYDFQLASVELTPEALSEPEAVIIATDHSIYDYSYIVRHARLVIDTRNATRNVKENRDKIVQC